MRLLDDLVGGVYWEDWRQFLLLYSLLSCVTVCELGRDSLVVLVLFGEAICRISCNRIVVCVKLSRLY
jgi:hypothetical protein